MEPVAELVIHFLRSIADKPAPDAYAALMHAVSDPFDEDDGAPGWVRFLEQHRIALRTAERSRRGAAMRNAVDAFVKRFSSAHLLALSSDYGDTAYVDSIVSTVCDHLEVLVDETGDLAVALSRFAAEGTVRIMTIHKCKGMEFDAVIMPGTETQTWWAKRGEERNAFFVGVSRAKSHLLVTHADRREKPAGYPRQWKVSRDADEEFLEYVLAEAGEGLPRET
jgi:superfamily I DNA/RNA helicase